MYYPFVRKALFQLDPERAHEFTFQQLRRITGTPFEALVRQKVPAKPVNCMGLTFKRQFSYCGSFRKRGHRGGYPMAYLRPWRSTFRWAGGKR